METLIRRLDAWMAAHRPALYARLKPGATDKEIAALRRGLGIAPPEELLALLRWRNGQAADAPAFQHNRALCGTAEILSDRQMYRELLAAGDIEHWNDGWIPFMRSWGGDVLCIDAAGTRRGVPGELFIRTSDDEEYSPDYPSLRAWLQVFVETLETGLWRDDGDLQPTDEDTLRAHIGKVAPGYPVAGDE